MPDPSLRTLLDVAIEAAYLAGRRTLAYFNTDVAVETKVDDTPVTCADRQAEQVIRAVIGRYFPSHSILGEESGEARGDPRFRWIIDPIDGTKSFIHGVPLYAVLIGLEIDQRPSLGVIDLPALDEIVYAAAGLGCRWNGRAATVSSVDQLEQATVLTSSVLTAMRRSDAYERLAGRARLNRTWGDAYGYALVATGRAEIMLDPVINPWDIAPMLPILSEAGGRFSDWQGTVTTWGPDAVATNAALYDQVIAVLRSEQRR
ncbi:histidinol-phosphatase [Fontivita pretiosa]|uniref:histidinol-phosphatase n=1 Tax=Fontivita pretiosa TaxID=2989684 RepID=UPI003D174CCA